MPRPLSNDDLGEKGEKRFGELCADAGLTANAVTRDRAGFDYIVDFRFDDSTKNLDSRPPPPSVRVQVKTHWADGDEVRLRLSAAEQLIKHPGPSFICALAVNSNADLQFSRMNVIHCRGEIVERVLRRLREAEVRGEKPNKIWLRVKPSDFSSDRPVHHAELRRCLEDACALSPLAYLKEKDRELNTVGFAPGARELKVDFSGTPDDITDAFLGLRPIDVSAVSESLTRFGITLPLADAPTGPGVMRFQPAPEKCEVSVHTDSSIYNFRAKIFRAPAYVGSTFGKYKALIRAGILQIKLAFHGHVLNATISRDEAAPLDDAHKIQEWCDLYAMLAAMTEGGAHFTVKTAKAKPLEFHAHDPESEAREDWQKLARLTNAAATVFERAGAPNAKASLEHLWVAGNELTTLAALIREPGQAAKVTFTTDADVPLPRPGPLDMLLGHVFQVGTHVIAYGAKIVVSGAQSDDGVEWISTSMELLGVARVKSERGFMSFMRRLPRQPYAVFTGFYEAHSPTIFAAADIGSRPGK
ncbi:hypothetical protein [Brevundimonas sp.]|uniref:hypothetical protein n=1 Tax=Brevundimonas sp. TaxID=1871086 RepID=UPI0025CBFD5B|nr:hypothetical protein [Brevundimonas sp.]